MATFKYIQRTNKKNGRGECPIWLRITHQRKTAFVNTGIYVTEKQWNPEEQRVRKNHKSQKKLNYSLDKLSSRALDIALQLRDENKESAQAIKTRLKGGESSNNDVLKFTGDYIDQLPSGEFWKWKHFRVLLGKLNDFQDGKPLPFENLDETFIQNFDKYLKEKGNGRNTRMKVLGRLKIVVKEAIKAGLMTKWDNPFIDFKMTRDKTRKDTLTLDQIERIEALELEPQSWLWHTRNYFMFAFYTGGMRFGDLALLRWHNVADGVLNYRMQKTLHRNKEPVILELLPQAQQILDLYRNGQQPDDFVFPLLPMDLKNADERSKKRSVSSKNALVNKYLKQIQKLAEIPVNVSFHTARHSFAYVMHQKNIPIKAISEMLGHSSVTITENYAKELGAKMVSTHLKEAFKNEPI